jgi:hypothetical protein
MWLLSKLFTSRPGKNPTGGIFLGLPELLVERLRPSGHCPRVFAAWNLGKRAFYPVRAHSCNPARSLGRRLPQESDTFDSCSAFEFIDFRQTGEDRQEFQWLPKIRNQL